MQSSIFWSTQVFNNIKKTFFDRLRYSTTIKGNYFSWRTLWRRWSNPAFNISERCHASHRHTDTDTHTNCSKRIPIKGFLPIGDVSHADIEISRTKESPDPCLLLCINHCWEPDIKLDFQNPSLCWVAEDRHPFIRDNLLIVGMDHIIDRKG